MKLKYAIQLPGGKYQIYENEVPDSHTYESLGVYPVNDTVPSGYRKTSPDLQLISGVCRYSIEPIPTPTVVIPEEVTNRQFRRAILQSGLSPAYVTQVLNTIEDPIVREIAVTDWEYGNTFRIDHPLFVEFAPIFGFTTGDLGNLFIEASKFE